MALTSSLLATASSSSLHPVQVKSWRDLHVVHTELSRLMSPIAVSGQIVSSCVIFGITARGALLAKRSPGLPFMNQPQQGIPQIRRVACSLRHTPADRVNIVAKQVWRTCP